MMKNRGGGGILKVKRIIKGKQDESVIAVTMACLAFLFKEKEKKGRYIKSSCLKG